MKFQIDDCHFESDGDYLDIKVNTLEGYITLKTDTTGEFSLDSELDIDILCQKLKELLQVSKGEITPDIDRRIPGVGC